MKDIRVTTIGKGSVPGTYKVISEDTMPIDAAAELYPIIEALEDSIAVYETFNLEIRVEGIDVTFRFELIGA